MSKVELKTKQTKASVAKFVEGIPEESRRRDCESILKIMKRVTKLKPKMWGRSIIGFGSYHYKYATGHEGDAPMAGFLPRKQSLTIYLVPGFTERPELVKLLDKLGKHKTSVSCLYINKLSDVHLATLEKLIASSFGVCRKQLAAKSSA